MLNSGNLGGSSVGVGSGLGLGGIGGGPRLLGSRGGGLGMGSSSQVMNTMSAPTQPMNPQMQQFVPQNMNQHMAGQGPMGQFNQNSQGMPPNFNHEANLQQLPYN